MADTISIAGPSLPFSEEIHRTKYRLENETFRESMNRVANALKDSDEHYHLFRDIILNMRFMPAGRIQAAMDSNKHVTPYNCYVSGVIEDSFTSDGGIMYQATKAAETMRMGGGIGYDFSTLRPRGELIKSLQSRASGPVSFMDIYDSVCRTIASAGHRRGAQMGVLRVDHPDIEEFIRVKQSHVKIPTLWELVNSIPEDDPRKATAFKELQEANELTGFNISVGVTDEFMHAVDKGNSFNLRWNGQIYKTIDARVLWEQIMRASWDWGEPGVLFLDTINKMNNLWYCETISATNPCGEQPLPPYGACLLGSFNLTKYISKKGKGKGKWVFDWEQFKADIAPVVRALDNVVDRALYPLPEQEREAKSKRRMGLGVTGLANAAEALGLPYGTSKMCQFVAKVLETLTVECYWSSVNLAKEKGSFELFDKEKYCQSQFITRLPADLQEAIYKYGIRNSHLTSIAPTGTISLAADNCSNGLEPVVSYNYERAVIDFDGTRMTKVTDYGHQNFKVKGKLASECSADDHVNVLLTACRYVDSSVSKTCNVSSKMPWEDFKDIYMRAWKGSAKGCTTFNPEGKRLGIYKISDGASGEDSGVACFIDEAGNKECE